MRRFRVVLPVMLMFFTALPCRAQMPPMGAPPALNDLQMGEEPLFAPNKPIPAK